MTHSETAGECRACHESKHGNAGHSLDRHHAEIAALRAALKAWLDSTYLSEDNLRAWSEIREKARRLLSGGKP